MTQIAHWLLAAALAGGMLVAGATTNGAAFAQQPGTEQGTPSKGQDMMERLKAANTTHDGRLTLEQAQAANLTPIVRRFSEIDVDHKGYITMQDIRAYREKMRGGAGGEGGMGD